MEERIGILADDLTSAADGAAPFVAQGHRAVIGRLAVPSDDHSVVATDSESRSMLPSDASAHVARLAAQLASRTILYKTVDSTLRGHVRIELEAAFQASGRRTLVFAPAFPAAGRTTVRGVQLVDGVPVTESVYGRDPVHPARHSRLADLVPSGIGSVIILDAATQEELEVQVAALPDPGSILWVGSPGMAAALAARFGPATVPSVSAPSADGDILVAIGSANPRSHRQADAIDGDRGITVLRAPLARADDPAGVLDQIAQNAVDRLTGGGFGAVIATGGDTMEAILDRLRVSAFEILREIEPGFPLGRAVLDDGRQLLLAMKAGGFGDDQALARAIAQLRPNEPAQVSP